MILHDEQEQMSLSAFLSRMQSGWGFNAPLAVRRIGDALGRIFGGRDTDCTVSVRHQTCSHGIGPDHRYTYSWYVRGVDLPDSPEDPAEWLTHSAGGFEFGYTK